MNEEFDQLFGFFGRVYTAIDSEEDPDGEETDENTA